MDYINDQFKNCNVKQNLANVDNNISDANKNSKKEVDSNKNINGSDETNEICIQQQASHIYGDSINIENNYTLITTQNSDFINENLLNQYEKIEKALLNDNQLSLSRLCERLESTAFQNTETSEILKFDKNNKDESKSLIIFDKIKSFLINKKGLQFEKSFEEFSIYDSYDLPNNLIVTSLPNDIFNTIEIKKRFEEIFLNIDDKCKFSYFKSFKRCCIQFESPIYAVFARFLLDDHVFLNNRLKIFLSKPIKIKSSKAFLEPPKNDKTFLISPPSSPPVGWEQHIEDPPVVNLDLLAALSKLNPDQPCELVKPNNNSPAIIIHPCADMILDPSEDSTKRKFIPTKRPANDF